MMALLGKSERGLACVCCLPAHPSSFGAVCVYSPGMLHSPSQDLLAHRCLLGWAWEDPKTISFGLRVLLCRVAGKLLSLKLTGSSVVASM